MGAQRSPPAARRSRRLHSAAQGAHSITASYSGDAANTASVSSALTQTVNVAPPSAPSNLAATASGSSQINLAWTASATSGVTYDVYQSNCLVGLHAVRVEFPDRERRGSSTSYSATGLSGSTTYYFRVSAVNAGGESADTNQAGATTTAALSCHVSYKRERRSGPELALAARSALRTPVRLRSMVGR